MEKLREVLLNDMDVLKQVVGEINSWDGSLEHLDVHENDEEFFNSYFEGRPAEAVRATFYGDYRYADDYVRFNGYGNLESLTDYQLEEEMKSYIDDIILELINKRQYLSLDPDIEDLLDEEDDEEDEE
jgi:hypothetical protein